MSFILRVASSAAALASLAGSPVALAAPCGDTAGRNGKDVACRCGDTVVTDTVLSARDPVTKKACPAGGLTVNSGLNLNLNGRIVSGTGTGVGIRTDDETLIRNGTVRRFQTGVLVDRGSVVLTDLVIDANLGSGLVLDPAAGATPVVT